MHRQKGAGRPQFRDLTHQDCCGTLPDFDTETQAVFTVRHHGPAS